MKIILLSLITKDKNVVFVSDTFQVLSLEETARLVNSGIFEDMSVVRRGSEVYLRTKRNVPKERELGSLALSINELTAFAQGLSVQKAPSQSVAIWNCIKRRLLAMRSISSQ